MSAAQDAIGAERAAKRLSLINHVMASEPHDNSLAGKTFMLIGGSGQIGLCVLGKALARGAHVIATYDRNPVAFSHPNLEWVPWSMGQTTLEGRWADCLMYYPSLWSLPGTLPSLHAAGIRRVIAYGSTSQFSKVNSQNKYEQDIVAKLQSSEKEIMQFAAETGMHITIMRPTMIYGVGLDANIAQLARTIRRFGAIFIYGRASGMRQPVQAADLAQASLDASFAPATFGKCYNLGGGNALSYRDMLAAIFRHLGKKPRFIRLPFMPQLLDWFGKYYGGGYINGEMARRMNQDLQFDMSDAIRDFGYSPKKFLEGYVVI